MLPDRVVITYQGDGDLAAIGGNEILHAANRGENITVFFVNNACYGMTGGQMAPTTLLNQKTTTTPNGRSLLDGYPMKVCELLSGLEGVAYAERTAVNSPKNIRSTKNAIKKALECQINGEGFSIVEILAMCPTAWRVDPIESLDVVERDMIGYFPLGIFKEIKN